MAVLVRGNEEKGREPQVHLKAVLILSAPGLPSGSKCFRLPSAIYLTKGGEEYKITRGRGALGMGLKNLVLPQCCSSMFS